MASNIIKYESLLQSGEPIECYKFTHDGIAYMYTSSAQDIQIPMGNGSDSHTEKYAAEVIKRAELLPGDTESMLTCKITVSKDNPIAMLWQGPPPETPVNLKIYRLHDFNKVAFDTILDARIASVEFNKSECILTANQESWLDKELPNGLCQYYCNHTLFDHNCGLNKADYMVKAFVDHVEYKTEIWSADFAKYPDGYFVGGKIYSHDNVRLINYHQGNKIRILYPFASDPRNDVTLVPGCDLLFKTCVNKYHNHLNFGGVPYVPPTDAEHNTVGAGVYWQDSTIVKRDTDGSIGVITGV